jgi:Raf kinase inhibitor-like YbhB/YbcL family protein
MFEKLPEVVGHVLRDQRAGLDKIAFNQLKLRGGTAAIEVRSLAFADHAPIPAVYTADGDGVSPPLEWLGIPAAAAALILIVEDADSPTPQPLVHAIVADLPARDGALAEGVIDRSSAGNEEATIGRNSFLQAGWLPPDPPPGHGVHRYVFQLFALVDGPGFGSTPGREAVMEMLQERAIASGILTGTYERPDGSIKVKDGKRARALRRGGLVGP